MACPICSDPKYRAEVYVCPICKTPGGASEIDELARQFIEEFKTANGSIT